MWEYVSVKLAHLAIILLNFLAPVGINLQRNVAYAPGDLHRVDIYQPRKQGKETARPVIVFLYGGSWRSGSKERVAFVGSALARNDFVVVIPEYRHYPSVNLPDILSDNAAAVAWTILHALEIGGDPQRVFVAGHSSGAWAAVMLALDGKWLEHAGSKTSALAGVIGMSGPYMRSSLTEPGDKEIFAGVGPEMEPIEVYHAGRPAMLLLAGEADTDVLPFSTTAFSDRMRAIGNEVETRVYAGMDHDEILYAVSFPFNMWSKVSADTETFISRLKITELPQPRSDH